MAAVKFPGVYLGLLAVEIDDKSDPCTHEAYEFSCTVISQCKYAVNFRVVTHCVFLMVLRPDSTFFVRKQGRWLPCHKFALSLENADANRCAMCLFGESIVGVAGWGER